VSVNAIAGADNKRRLGELVDAGVVPGLNTTLTVASMARRGRVCPSNVHYRSQARSFTSEPGGAGRLVHV